VAERVIKMPFELPKILQNFYAIFVVMIGWVFFRSPDLNYSLSYLQTMFSSVESAAISNDVARLMQSHFVWMSVVLALMGMTPLPKNIALKLMRRNKIFLPVFDIFLIAILLVCVVRISAATHNPFIYFQF
jgi:alginate O-acetyltransferase complex protein AlgI